MELTDDSRESRLLTLPPELRNIIYRHALVDGTFKIYGSGPSTQPSLLQVNHQIRHEAIQLYYSENFFAWHIRAFDTTQYLTWCQSCPHRRHANSKVKFVGPRNWANLLRWLEAYYHGKCGKLESCRNKGRADRGKVIMWPCQLVENLSREDPSTWEKVKANLEIVHEMICAADATWDRERDAE